MTSFIICSTDKKKRVEFAKDFFEKKNIDRFDITLIQKEEDSKNLQTIGVQDVKKIQGKIFLKPLHSKEKAVIIEDADLLTIEAQNALLKALEEPPANTYIMLGAESSEKLLPTLLSRCQMIKLKTPIPFLSKEELEELTDFASNLNKMAIGDRLKKAEILAKNKDEAIIWIEKLILVLREQMLVNFSHKKNAAMEQLDNGTIRQLQSLHTLLKTTNVNPRFAIENTLLSLIPNS